ncbi:helix-turn-helix domain-containing protein [Paraburkholderia sp. Cpub6]|uniref:helix-turn-helix domain-containing protein n=1 Tax=Paraburkholderia sp. Cpub6 TaxID=2723094 RepID=UPI001607C9DC|nr:helix-turn-helix domain-containing protein [Paraburkholderia sp. Cpub6]MBB5463860.1 excisionase family DNA binding protein [Paraburkholderia sp. Cpub6]
MGTLVTVDINGAADMMKVHPKTILDLIRDGVLPAARIGRAYVLLSKDVLDYVQQQITNQTAERLAIQGRQIRPPDKRPRRTRRSPPNL